MNGNNSEHTVEQQLKEARVEIAESRKTIRFLTTKTKVQKFAIETMETKISKLEEELEAVKKKSAEELEAVKGRLSLVERLLSKRVKINLIEGEIQLVEYSVKIKKIF